MCKFLSNVHITNSKRRKQYRAEIKLQNNAQDRENAKKTEKSEKQNEKTFSH